MDCNFKKVLTQEARRHEQLNTYIAIIFFTFLALLQKKKYLTQEERLKREQEGKRLYSYPKQNLFSAMNQRGSYHGEDRCIKITNKEGTTKLRYWNQMQAIGSVSFGEKEKKAIWLLVNHRDVFIMSTFYHSIKTPYQN